MTNARNKKHRILNFWQKNWLYIIAGALMIIGLILTFAYLNWGGALVGLGFGLAFSEEIRSYFFRAKDFFASQGLFKTLMLLGAALYLLITATVFLIAAIVGFIIAWLLRLGKKR